MSGNVWEWCFDMVRDSSYRRIRGGGWYAYAYHAAVASRDVNFNPDLRNAVIGFRLARSSGN